MEAQLLRDVAFLLVLALLFVLTLQILWLTSGQHQDRERRLTWLDGRWLASADTASGPSLGTGQQPIDALTSALEAYDGIIDELLATVPDQLYWARADP